MVLSMNRWLGKVAIVTGASSGIGASIASHLVQNGLIVVGFARRTNRIKDLSRQLSNFAGKLYAVKTDISREEDVLAAFDWVCKNLGPVHILVNNAGVFQHTNLTAGDTGMWKKVLDVNVLGLCVATREAMKIMTSRGINGHIIHVNSVAGHQVPSGLALNMYPASKYAVTALTETLRQELVTLGSKIKVTSVSPGGVVTEMTVENADEAFRRKANYDAMLKPEDIADGVVYALSTPEHVQVHELTIKPVGERF